MGLLAKMEYAADLDIAGMKVPFYFFTGMFDFS